MKIKSFLFTIFSFVIIIPPILASTQDLTYNSDTNQVNITYDSLNRMSTKYILHPNLIGLWLLDDGSGSSTAKDDSGIGNTGNLTNMNSTGNSTSGWTSSCTTGNCLRFDGINDRVNFGNPSILNFGTSDFTITAWFNRNADTETNQRLLAKGALSDTDPGYGFFASNSSITFFVGNGSNRIIFSTGNAYNPNEWHFVTGVRNATNLVLYLDGVQRATRPINSTYNVNSNINFAIGGTYNSANTFHTATAWNGTIDEVRIYNKALTKDEVGRVYRGGNIKTVYSYDDQYDGTLANISFGNSTYKYEYDDKLRLTKETRIINGITFERKIYYDSMDRMLKQDFTPGQDINYTYNNQSKLGKINGFINSIFYSAFDNPSNRTYDSNRSTEFAYDIKGRVTEIKTGPLQNMSYSYDAVGNIIRINDMANDRLYDMSYDLLDRLVNATIGNIIYVYSYNEIGNILKIVRDNDNTTKFVYGNNPVHAPSKIIVNDAGTDTNNLEELFSNAKHRIISFFLSNEKESTITDVNWTIDFENQNKINSTLALNLTNNESVWVIAGYNYSNSGRYKINVTSRSEANSIDFENTTTKFGVTIHNLTVQSRDISNITFSLGILNDMNATSQNIQWSCSEGLSGGPFTLSGNASRIELVSNNYSTPGIKAFSCNTTSFDGNESGSIEFGINGVEIEDYNNTALDSNTRMINFTIKNYWLPLSVRWYITSNGQTFTNTASLTTNGTTMVSQIINYTADGNKDVIVNASSGSIIARYNESFNLNAIRIEDYDSLNLTSTNRLMEFRIKNNWPDNQSIRWNVTDPSLSSNAINLASEEFVFVLIENNYTTQGTKKPQITAYNNTFADSVMDRFLVKVIEILRHLVLYESRESTISEMDAINNLGQTNISWTVDTGEQNITSTQTTTLNNSEQVIVIIESNYTGSNVYVTRPTVNSSSYNDTTAGVTTN